MKFFIIILMWVLALCGIFISQGAFAYEKNRDCSKHPIYCQIIANKPTVKRSYAFKLSNVIHNNTRKYKINPMIFTAILAQESMYEVSAKNCTTGILEKTKPEFDIFKTCMKFGKIGSDKFVKCMYEHQSYLNSKIRICTDFGIGQIWYKTADSYDFDFDKLTSNMEYSVEAAAIVLEYFKNRYSHKEKTWWTRYNANNSTARLKYRQLVERFIYAD